MKRIWFAALLLTAACSSDDQQANTSKDKLVKAIRTESSTQTKVRTFSGITEPNKEVNLSFRVSGPLSQFNMEEGQAIKRGERLGVIDTRDFKINLQKAEAQFEQAKAEMERTERLKAKNNVSQQQYEYAKATFLNATANLEAAQNALKDTQLNSPFSGYVKSVMTEKGEHINAKQSVLIVQDFSAVKVRCNIPASLAMQQENIEKVSVRFDEFPNKEFEAIIKEIGRDANALNNAYPMILEIENKNNELIGSMSAAVDIKMQSDTKSSIQVPSTAIMGLPLGGAYVWAFNAKDNQLQKVDAKVNQLNNDDWVEVELQSEQWDWIVSAGGCYLHEGQKVRVQEEVRHISMR
ncbi:efflux RND transporter periplasmic adaptor subunit [Sediminitomix flava]|uniref:RND family efflux transporter MFP subunit n=1 Tax=Sediminitomix flava TaxID=379075 RepID=A0A316A3C7_SEDFL|nr:efflux RND transporter periplasmic adaptor subunit [Sediminitomix flava]PWJ44227.1 RND family efflux transporter MFP subunit [Sediminitomix flava]